MGTWCPRRTPKVFAVVLAWPTPLVKIGYPLDNPHLSIIILTMNKKLRADDLPLRQSPQEASQRRKTRQRQVILEELQAVTSHPTAVELYQLVQRRLPRVSLGTVYRNLDLLRRMGLIERLENSGGEARFDANTSQHDHLRCLHCGRVDDVTTPLELARPEDHDLHGYEVIGHRLEFIGICPRCRQSASRQCSAANRIPGSAPTLPGETEHA